MRASTMLVIMTTSDHNNKEKISRPAKISPFNRKRQYDEKD